MKKTRLARILSFILALTLVFACMSPSSYALSKQQFGAWIAAALQAINITATATATGAADVSRDFMDWLSAPVKVVASQFVDVPYTTPIESIDDYLSRSTIQIDKDKVTIDGVEYTDIWLSNDASEKFRVNAFDLENAFDIASKSEGTFTSGVGYFQDIPIFDLSNGSVTSYKSQKITLEEPGTFLLGNTVATLSVPGYPTGRPQLSWNFDGSTSSNSANNSMSRTSTFTFQVQAASNSSIYQQGTLRCNFQNEYGSNDYFNVNKYGNFRPEPFDFDWVSGTIPADEVLPENEGLRIRVPTEDIEDWYTQYPGTGDSVVINMGDPDLEAKVDDLIDLIIPIIPILDIDFTEKDTPAPAPDPEPVPDPKPYPDQLPDPSISLIDSTLKDIVQALKNIYDGIAIGNTFSEAIKNLNDKINWSLDDIKEKIGDLTDRIERGSVDWFRDIVQSIWQPFLPILNIFRSGVGIWHYVVEWLQAVHAPFVTFWNFLGSAGYIFLTPIYAAAAASIVLAIYRRFGR